MKLYIPEIGDKLRLTKEWEFLLYTERRNDTLVSASSFSNEWKQCAYYGKHDEAAAMLGWLRDDKGWDYHRLHVLPIGTELTIDRIYIRKGLTEYSSVSFFLNRKSVDEKYSMFCKRIHNMKGKCRFWAKLADVNNIEFELL